MTILRQARLLHHRNLLPLGVWCLCVLFAFIAACWVAGIRLNLTASMPVGIYVAAKGVPTRGSTVLVCLPPSVAHLARERGYVPRGGSCSHSTIPIGKPVFALPGDTVIVAEGGLLLNGKLTPNTQPLPSDRHGRPLTRLVARQYIVQPNELWVVSAYSRFSFDSRYFGAVSLTNVRARVRLILPFSSAGAGSVRLEER
jgi:conjugative transfer signal peptidase TraF